MSQPQKLVAKFKLDVEPDQFMSTFVPAFAMTESDGNPKVGAEFSFNVFIEESRFFVPGDFKILRIVNTTDGKRLFQSLCRYGSNKIEYFNYMDGQVLGYRIGEVTVFLTKNREEAIGELPYYKEQIQKLFGDLPFGLENPVSRSQGRIEAKKTILVAPVPTEMESKYIVSASAKKLGRRPVSK